jgi:hypothetical protein
VLIFEGMPGGGGTLFCLVDFCVRRADRIKSPPFPACMAFLLRQGCRSGPSFRGTSRISKRCGSGGCGEKPDAAAGDLIGPGPIARA